MNQFCTFLVLMMIPLIGSADPWLRHTIDCSSRGADGVRVLDVNGDELLDVVTGWEEGGVIRAYLNPGPAKSKANWPAVTVGRVMSPEDAVFADLDADGAVDVISSCEGGNKTVYFHWAPRNKEKYLESALWETVSVPCTKKLQAWMFAVPMQIDGEHGLDVIVGSKGAGAAVGWLEAPENAREVAAWKYHSLCDAGWIMSIQTKDMDDDDDLDIVASDRKGATRGVFWLENPGKNHVLTKNWKRHAIGGEDREVMFMTIADLDNDRATDILCAVKGGGICRMERHEKEPSSWSLEEIAMPPGCGTGKGVAVADLDLDGSNTLDIVFSCENAKGALSGLRWMRNSDRSDGSTWTDFEISGPLGVKFDRIELIDLDQDGDVDAVSCEERENLGVIWFENPAK